MSPPQIAALLWLYHDQLEEDASNRIWSLLGQAVHVVLERTDPDAETEHRLFAECHGWLISEAIDRLVPDPQRPGKAVIEDYKITSAWSVLRGPKSEWIDQLHVLQWLAECNGHDVQRLSIVTILRD